MKSKSKRAKATEFDKETRLIIHSRDRGKCLFCELGKYGKSGCTWIMDIAHYINRSAGGLGIEENGVLLCRGHHMQFDNGNKGYREEMKKDVQAHLQSHYSHWNEADLYYKKY